MKRWLFITLLFLSLTVIASPTELFPLITTAEQQQFSRLTTEIRCLVCQNESIADSNAPIARDLKKKVYEMVKEGNNDTDIKNYLVERYGEFVLFKPRLNTETLLLWFAPIIFLLLGFITVLFRIRHTSSQDIA